MSDRDVVVVASDEYFADDQPQDALLVFDGQLVEAVGEAAEEAVERIGELEVGLGVVQFGVERVELRAQRALALAERGRAGTQLIERDELFLVGLDQAGDRGVGAREVALERLAALGRGVLGAQRPQPAVNLGAHERGIFE